MAGVNKAILIGHLGKDPDVRSLNNNGNQVASFSLATSESWRDKRTGERVEKTDWHNIVIFNENLVKVVDQYCKKGSKVYLEGKLRTRKWQDKDGADRYTTEIVLENFNGQLVLLDGKSSGGSSSSDDGGGERRPALSGGSKPGAEIDDDIPF